MVCRLVRKKTSGGFSLFEMVIVILVLGLIAGVAAPKMFGTASDARANSTKQNLVVIRDALELYKVQNGVYPDKNTIGDDLACYLRGPFPASQVGNGAGMTRCDRPTPIRSTTRVARRAGSTMKQPASFG